MTLKDTFELNGFLGPLEIMSREETNKYKEILKETSKKLKLMNSDYRCKSNVLFPWVDKISRNPKLVEYLTQLIGPNFHCWDTLFWIKEPGDNRDVSFHQDATYWNFNNKHLAVTVWFAFDDVTEDQGSVEYVKGSHRRSQQQHKDVKTDTNLLMRGQTVDVDVPEERVKTAVPAGNILIHSPYIIHGSSKNKSNRPRLAMGMIFASTKCKPITEYSPESTIMIAGNDTNNYMLHDPAPLGNWEVDLENWREAYDRQHINYYRMEQSI